MFKPQPMLRVELLIPEADIIPVTEALARSELFHLDAAEGTPTVKASDTKLSWHNRALDFAALERRTLTVMEELHITPGEQPPIIHLISLEIAQRDIVHLEQEAEPLVTALEAAQRRLAQLQQYERQLQPLAQVEIDLGQLRQLRYTFALLGTLPAPQLERLRHSLEQLPYTLTVLRRDGDLLTVLLFGAQQHADILARAARSAYLTPLPILEQYRGTPQDALRALQEGQQRTRQHIVQYEAEIERLHALRVLHLRYLLWRVRASRTVAETIARYDYLHHIYAVDGWLPAEALPQLQETLRALSENVVFEVSPPAAREFARVPIALDNPPLLRAFQSLVTTYGRPGYGELDPTPLLALTFPLIFGFMFGDVGHGLLLALVGALLLSRKISAWRDLAPWGGILLACGSAAMGFGALYGSLFGFEDVLPALWAHPLESTTDVLLVAVGLGVVLLSVGMLYHILNAALSRNWGQLLFNRNALAGLFFYWSLLGLGLKVFGVALPLSTSLLGGLAFLCGALVTFSEPLGALLRGQRPQFHEGVGTYLILAFFELFETLLTLFSNTLSYVRMGAFAVAHGALSLVVFIIARILSREGSLGYWLIVALGNLFIIGFEGLIVGIQTLRLEYYEFFSKFFTGNGIPYRPLTLLPKTDA